MKLRGDSQQVYHIKQIFCHRVSPPCDRYLINNGLSGLNEFVAAGCVHLATLKSSPQSKTCPGVCSKGIFPFRL